VTNLKQKLDAELTGAMSRAQKNRQEWERYSQDLESGLKKFDAAIERLRPVWTPRLELLRDRFAKFSKVEPEVKPYARSVIFTFTSTYRVELTFSVRPDRDARNMVLKYDLLILPILIKFDQHAELVMPLDRVDEEAVGRWLDERILAFVQTYMTLQGDDFAEEVLAPA
jgi:hypothetical protein